MDCSRLIHQLFCFDKSRVLELYCPLTFKHGGDQMKNSERSVMARQAQMHFRNQTEEKLPMRFWTRAGGSWGSEALTSH